MVENSSSSKAQMPGLSPEGLNLVLSANSQFHHPSQGMKLEAVMEQLQRQHQARFEMESRERKERQIREAQLMYAQQLAAQQAILAAAAARASASQLPSPLARSAPVVAGPARPSDQGSMDSEQEEELFVKEEDLEDEVMERDDHEEEDHQKEAEAGLDFLRKQSAALQAQRPLSAPFLSQAKPGQPQREEEEEKETVSPGQPSSKSPSGQQDWGYEEQFKQNGGLAWNDEAEGGRGREASRDFAKLYELDNDPKRKEFLDDLFTFMQKRGECLWFLSLFTLILSTVRYKNPDFQNPLTGDTHINLSLNL
nr:PREDICTED: AT-rich interactive domain-containing protein 3B-like [Latimeria chalumnae]|eukprot:XP_014349303.1 PREDICTED: AT-rich interactive domain-containing protein 3B-like [Latimeria chalumnae]